MPLVKGQAAKTRKGFSANVKQEIKAGKPQKQAAKNTKNMAKNIAPIDTMAVTGPYLNQLFMR